PPPQKAKPQPPTLVLPPEPPSEVHSDKDPNPKGPKAPAGKQTATLRWADPNVPVADTFIIWRGDGECTTYKVLTQIKTGVKQSPYVDSTIRPNRVYCYAVSAVYGGTESAQSNFATATPPKTKNDKE
ncbi:MAG TPA: hypothetical protein VF077_11150, partial [Nitrospiraceae bacterium]